jgi:ribose transport system substrate-binding protein
MSHRIIVMCEGRITGELPGGASQEEIVVIGYDAGKQQKDAVRSGVMAGAVSQDPVGIGYKCVEAAVKAIKGEKVPRTIDTGYRWYDKSNIDSAEMKPLLYD